MEISLRSGGYDIVAHGETFLFEKDTDFTIDVKADDSFSFTITLQFASDSSGERRVESAISQNKIQILCMNFEESGEGLPAPVKIADIEDRGLYFMYWSFVDGSKRKVRSVRYTLFYEKESAREAD